MVFDNRSTQFAGFAKLLMQELLEPAGYIDIGRGDIEALADYEQRISCRVYDLVRHALYCNGIDSAYWPDYPLHGKASDIYERETTQDVSKIPDLTDLPEKKAQS